MATVRNTCAAFFLKGKRLACKWQEERWLLQLRPRLGSYRLRNGKISKMVFGREKNTYIDVLVLGVTINLFYLRCFWLHSGNDNVLL